MHVNGCFIDVKLDAASADGFSVTSVSKTMNGDTRVPAEQVLLRGPFKTIYAAQVYAHTWKDPANPPPIPVPEPRDPRNFCFLKGDRVTVKKTADSAIAGMSGILGDPIAGVAILMWNIVIDGGTDNHQITQTDLEFVSASTPANPVIPEPPNTPVVLPENPTKTESTTETK